MASTEDPYGRNVGFSRPEPLHLPSSSSSVGIVCSRTKATELFVFSSSIVLVRLSCSSDLTTGRYKHEVRCWAEKKRNENRAPALSTMRGLENALRRFSGPRGHWVQLCEPHSFSRHLHSHMSSRLNNQAKNQTKYYFKKPYANKSDWFSIINIG
jgi:hypothetical protein